MLYLRIKEKKCKIALMLHIISNFRSTLPGISSAFGSLYFTPREYAGEDSWIFLSAFSTLYEPGATQYLKKK